MPREPVSAAPRRRWLIPCRRSNCARRQRFRLSLFLLLLLSATSSWAQDPGWPRTLTKPGGKLVLYQPQVDDWKNYQQVDARMAFTLTPTGGKSHVGVVTVEMQSSVNWDDHTVFLSNPQVTSLSFPSLDPATTAQMNQLMKTFLNPAATMTISLDRLVASVQKTKTPPPTASLNNDPPAIFISFQPAILLLVNGAPVTAPIANSNMQFIVNANWPLFVEQGSSTYYLFDGKGWLDQRQPARQLDAHQPVAQADVEGPAEPEFRQPEGVYPAAPGQRRQLSSGVLQRHSGGDHRLWRPAAVDRDSGHATLVCVQHRTARCSSTRRPVRITS